MTKPRVKSVDDIVSFLTTKLLCEKWNVEYILKMYYRVQEAKVLMSTVTSEITNASRFLTDYFSFTYKATPHEQTISFSDR